MNIEVNDVITLHNNEKYLVLADALYNDQKYYLLIQVTEDEENIKDHFKIVKEKKDTSQTILIDVKDPNELDAVRKLFKVDSE